MEPRKTGRKFYGLSLARKLYGSMESTLMDQNRNEIVRPPEKIELIRTLYWLHISMTFKSSV